MPRLEPIPPRESEDLSGAFSTEFSLPSAMALLFVFFRAQNLPWYYATQLELPLALVQVADDASTPMCVPHFP